MTRRDITRSRKCFVWALWTLSCAACGNQFELAGAPLFVTPVSIDGTSIGTAIIDTGGGYELMLRDAYGLRLVDEVDVLAFAGRERVGVTESFSFVAGGIEAAADSAIVGRAICDCNGVGFLFFRKTGIVLGINFANGSAQFDLEEPTGGVRIPFATPPRGLSHFDSAFIEVDITSGDQTRSVLALLDTGTTGTVLRRGFLGTPSILSPNRLRITIGRSELGGVSLDAGLFDTPGLPDLIIGTDVMRVWSDRWYFRFDPQGGMVFTFPTNPPPSELNSVAARAIDVSPPDQRVGTLKVNP